MIDKSLLSVQIAVLTVSDARTEEDDQSGQLLVDNLRVTGHHLAEKIIVPNHIYPIRAVVSRWIEEVSVQIVLTTGGVGVAGRDYTPEAIAPLFR